MKQLGKILGWLLLGVNAICAIAMLFCAFSPYVNPVSHPVLSCSGLAFPLTLLLNLLWLIFWFLFYRKYMLLSLAAMICCGHSIWMNCPLNFFQKEPPESAIKILSYNVMHFNGGQPHTENSPNEILVYLQNCGADILCLQEYATEMRLRKSDIDKALSNYPYNHYYKVKGGSNGLACYSKYPILSATPIEYESSGNGSIRYTLNIDGDTLTVINNHLESNRLTEDDKSIYLDMIQDPETEKVKSTSKRLLNKLADTVPLRAAQADSVAHAIAALHKRALVVCGDFNTSPFSYAHRVIGRGLTDAFGESGKGFGVSYHKNLFYFRIDHLLISKDLRSYHCTVDSSIGISDHYPIWCYLSKRNNEKE